MAKGFCEECQECVGISPTPIPVGKDRDGNQVGSARRWRLDVHVDKREPVCVVESCNNPAPCIKHGWPFCEKSGDLI